MTSQCLHRLVVTGSPLADSAWCAEGLYGQCFVVFHIEYGVELRDLQQVVDSLGQVQQFDLAVLLFGSGEGTDKFADTGAVDIVHLAKVQQDPFLPLGKEVVHGITQSYAAFTEGDSTLEVDDRDAIGLTGAEIYAHGEAFPYLPKKSPGLT